MVTERDESISVAELVAACFVAVLTVLTTVLPAFYAAAGRAYPDALPLLQTLAWVSGLWAWLYAYTTRHRIALPMDAGWFLFIVWWLMVPYYLFRARGWRALIPLTAFATLWTAAYGITWLLWLSAEQ